MTPATAVSRRNVLRALTAAVSTLTLGGCAGLASTGSTGSEASALSVTPVLLVATTRKPVNGARGRPWFGPERGTGLGVARAKLTPPIEGGFSLAPVGLEGIEGAGQHQVLHLRLGEPVAGLRGQPDPAAEILE